MFGLRLSEGIAQTDLYFSTFLAYIGQALHPYAMHIIAEAKKLLEDFRNEFLNLTLLQRYLFLLCNVFLIYLVRQILIKHTFVDFSAWFNIKVVSKFETFPLTLYVCPIVPCKSQKHMISLSYSYYQKTKKMFGQGSVLYFTVTVE
ncbi:hypothetical protein T05_6231 [Trichinella murrelli]|uniref:Uncharacterized protein n=1 Tax=Trichinella murrelli TaxID=144512 RepID=A0A0V0TW31_9BILA|nr:hypothetical protein T05_6231 [Trichinella murrelli]